MTELREKIAESISEFLTAPPHDLYVPASSSLELADHILSLPEIAEALEARALAQKLLRTEPLDD